MKSNSARRIDDTDDPRLPHPMFPRSDGQPESRRIFYIRLFRKKTPNGPIEICPVRFLASESREEGWTHFVKRFGGGYYRAEATSSANKKQAYTGGSSLRWFHFPGAPKPFPSLDEARQAARDASAATYQASAHEAASPTWSEVRALIKSEQRFLAEQLEAERKAGDERLKVWTDHAARMAEADRERLAAMERLLREEREHAKQFETRLIEALKEGHHIARVREVEARQTVARITEAMRTHAQNEAMRIGYEKGEPVKIPRPRKPRSTSKSRARSNAKRKRTSAQGGNDFMSARALDGFAVAQNFDLRSGRNPYGTPIDKVREAFTGEARDLSEAAIAAYLARRNAASDASYPEEPAKVIDETQSAECSTASADVTMPRAMIDTELEPSAPDLVAPSNALDELAPDAETQAIAQAEQARETATRTPHDTPDASASDEEIPAQWANLPAWAVQALLRSRAQKQAEAQASAQREANSETASKTQEDEPDARGEETVCTPTDRSPIIQQAPPLNDPEGMTSIRTLGGWVTVPREWLKPDALPSDIAALRRVLDLARAVSVPKHP